MTRRDTDEVIEVRDVLGPHHDLYYLAYAEDQWGPVCAAKGQPWRCLVPECSGSTIGDPCAHMQAASAYKRPPEPTGLRVNAGERPAWADEL